jgi:hypothetical protein
MPNLEDSSHVRGTKSIACKMADHHVDFAMNGPGDESIRFSLVLRLDWNKGMPIPAAVD